MRTRKMLCWCRDARRADLLRHRSDHARQLTGKVKDRLANKPDKRVYIKADARAQYGNVVQVVDNVRAAGVDDVGLLTEQKHGGPASTAPPPLAGTSSAGR